MIPELAAGLVAGLVLAYVVWSWLTASDAVPDQLPPRPDGSVSEPAWFDPAGGAPTRQLPEDG